MKRIKLAMNSRCMEFCMTWEIPERRLPSDDIKEVSIWFYNLACKLKKGSPAQKSALNELRDICRLAFKVRDIRFPQQLLQQKPHLKASIREVCGIFPHHFYTACRGNWKEGVHLFGQFLVHDRCSDVCLCPTELGEYCGRNFDPEALDICKPWRDRETVYTIAAVHAIKRGNRRALKVAFESLELPDDVHTLKRFANEWLSDGELFIDERHHVALEIIAKRDRLIKEYEVQKAAEREFFIQCLPLPFDVAKFASCWL
jgi:hypothetical protein